MKRILKTLLIICAVMDFPYELFVLVKRSTDILCCAMLKQWVIRDRIVSTPFSILFPIPSSFMSTCVGCRISLPTFVTLAINTQVASSCATSCISRMTIRRAAILFPRPSVSRAHRIAALCDEERLADTLWHRFGGLLLVYINVLQIPVELCLRDAY